MALSYSIARFLIKPKNVDRNIIHRLRRSYIFSAEVSTFNSEFETNKRTYASNAAQSGVRNNTLLSSTFTVIGKYESLRWKVFRNQVLWDISKRNKGHAKWQNIAHTKAANDHKNSQKCNKYVSLITIAIKENSNITDPKQNTALAKVMADAQAENVPKATVENAIKRAKNSDAVMVENVFEVRGPGNTFIIVETFAKSKVIAMNQVQNRLKKAKAGILDKGLLNTFERRGVIVAKSTADFSLESAEEDAIECGAEEVVELESSEENGGKIFEFLSSPIDFTSVKDSLSAKVLNGAASYEILSANVDYVPVGQYVELDSPKEQDAFNKLVTLLNENEMVTGVYHNCNTEV